MLSSLTAAKKSFANTPVIILHKSVVFRESVRKIARDCFEKKGFAGNRHFEGTANFGYLEAIKCHFEARK